MTTDALDNPIWSALICAQAHFAIGGPLGKRYPAEVAPFIAAPDASAASARALTALVEPGEIVNIVGVAPKLDAAWEVLATGNIVQMVWRPDAPIPKADATDITALTDADTADMLALTGLVFPGYFRRRTPEMGEYYGIRQDSRFAAMGRRAHEVARLRREQCGVHSS